MSSATKTTAAKTTAAMTTAEFRAAGTDLSERRRTDVSQGPVIDLAPAPIARFEKRRIIQPKIMPMNPASLSGERTPGAICLLSSGRSPEAVRSGEAASKSRHGAFDPGTGFCFARC